MRKQFATALRSDARDTFERRGSPRFSASGTVAGNGETVRLVAHLLDQVQRRRVCGKRELVSRIVEVKGFQPRLRSEEHTSELQSLMRISYAVFCLKKKKTINNYIKT